MPKKVIVTDIDDENLRYLAEQVYNADQPLTGHTVAEIVKELEWRPGSDVARAEIERDDALKRVKALEEELTDLKSRQVKPSQAIPFKPPPPRAYTGGGITGGGITGSTSPIRITVRKRENASEREIAEAVSKTIMNSGKMRNTM